MCKVNYALHNGCGHITRQEGCYEYTLCDAAKTRLPSHLQPRAPQVKPSNVVMPIKSSPAQVTTVFSVKTTPAAPVKRTGSIFRTGSLRSSKSGATAAAALTKQNYGMCFNFEMTLPRWALEQALCPQHELEVVHKRLQEDSCCPRCKKIIDEMRNLVAAYDKTKNIKGCQATWYMQIARPDDPVE
jgi:hypothetical protein